MGQSRYKRDIKIKVDNPVSNETYDHTKLGERVERKIPAKKAKPCPTKFEDFR